MNLTLNNIKSILLNKNKVNLTKNISIVKGRTYKIKYNTVVLFEIQQDNTYILYKSISKYYPYIKNFLPFKIKYLNKTYFLKNRKIFNGMKLKNGEVIIDNPIKKLAKNECPFCRMIPYISCSCPIPEQYKKSFQNHLKEIKKTWGYIPLHYLIKQRKGIYNGS